ncbi:hypothetical protein GCM10022409_22970 [Hymenobacter glaciei]|uniref:TIR domain-containing protein n=1 Tax=Hymenobacter glaciei TaxID=877209 RepID=A0ABP7U7T3_9BACT
MAALLPDFEHDIFISYRHNDDLADGWVTEFVARLQNQLAATIKPRLSIYFDKDRSEGLGTTHMVGPSLEHRLRSFILIPLISQTYCDTSKFSWRQEFLPFLEQARADRLGLYLNLPGGNVGSRVLPVLINNLEREDEQLLKATLEGHLRSIRFVYEELGVNRPLSAKDDDQPLAPGGLLYRNQINRVATAIKELVAAATLPAVSAPAALPLPSAAVPVAIPAVASAVSVTAPVAAPVVAPMVAPASAAATGPVVFLAWTTDKLLLPRRDELVQVCTQAGLVVVPTADCPRDDDEFRERTQEALAAAGCSLHLLGNRFGRCFDDDYECSYGMYAYQEARKQAAARPGFRQFMWHCPDAAQPVQAAQEVFINSIRNELTGQCVFTNAPSAMQLVADVRSTLAQAPPSAPPANEDEKTGICFVFNELDTEEANAITDRLSEEFPLDILTIEPDSEQVYKDLTVRRIPESKLAVVYFKHSADWALPFVKQVWRLVGGAGSTTPILFVGEDDPAHNKLHSFKAPKVISRIQPHAGVSEEVRRVFQQLNQPA